MTRVLFVLAMLLLSCCAKQKEGHPFAYDLHLAKVEGKGPPKAIVCCHGMGGDYRIIDYVHQYVAEDSADKPALFSFNFPDYGIKVGSFDPEKTYLGTVEELLPVIYVLKQVVLQEKFQEVTLYGFSAGGGAIINTLAALNTNTFDQRLQEIGITAKDKKKILAAIQKGKVLLDAPLKSVGEIKDSHETMHEIEVVSARYKANDMEPIDNLLKLKGLNLHFVVNFQDPDEVLSNRDDALYIERLKQVGRASVIIEGQGHSLPHPHLWDFYLSTFFK